MPFIRPRSLRFSAARRGVSLTEVLVALFIVAIGLIAILTLFPLGAIYTASAIKDDRAAYCIQMATVQARNFWKDSFDPDHDAGHKPNDSPSWREPAFRAMIAPHEQFVPSKTTYTEPQTTPPTFPTTGPQPVSPPLPVSTEPQNKPLSTHDGTIGSYPVLIDPHGFEYNNAATSSVQRCYLGGHARSIPRRTLTFTPWDNLVKEHTLPSPDDVRRPRKAANLTLLLDDLTFNRDNALTLPAGGTTAERAGGYSWAWMFRRQRYHQATLVDVTVLVFFRRPVDLPETEQIYGAGFQPNSLATTAVFNKNSTTVTLSWTDPTQRPKLRKGGWLIDATMKTGATTGQGGNGYTYRVISIQETAQNTFTCEIDEPARDNGSVAVVMEHLAECSTARTITTVSEPGS